jgi:transposase-like protein
MFNNLHTKRQQYLCHKCGQTKYLRTQSNTIGNQKESIVDSFVMLNNSNKPLNPNVTNVESSREIKRFVQSDY